MRSGKKSFIHKEYLSLLSIFIGKVYFDVPVMKGPKWYSLKKDLHIFISGTSICHHIFFFRYLQINVEICCYSNPRTTQVISYIGKQHKTNTDCHFYFYSFLFLSDKKLLFVIFFHICI